MASCRQRACSVFRTALPLLLVSAFLCGCHEETAVPELAVLDLAEDGVILTARSSGSVVEFDLDVEKEGAPARVGSIRITGDAAEPWGEATVSWPDDDGSVQISSSDGGVLFMAGLDDTLTGTGWFFDAATDELIVIGLPPSDTGSAREVAAEVPARLRTSPHRYFRFVCPDGLSYRGVYDLTARLRIRSGDTYDVPIARDRHDWSRWRYTIPPGLAPLTDVNTCAVLGRRAWKTVLIQGIPVGLEEACRKLPLRLGPARDQICRLLRMVVSLILEYGDSPDVACREAIRDVAGVIEFHGYQFGNDLEGTLDVNWLDPEEEDVITVPGGGVRIEPVALFTREGQFVFRSKLTSSCWDRDTRYLAVLASGSNCGSGDTFRVLEGVNVFGESSFDMPGLASCCTSTIEYWRIGSNDDVRVGSVSITPFTDSVQDVVFDPDGTVIGDIRFSPESVLTISRTRLRIGSPAGFDVSHVAENGSIDYRRNDWRNLNMHVSFDKVQAESFGCEPDLRLSFRTRATLTGRSFDPSRSMDRDYSVAGEATFIAIRRPGGTEVRIGFACDSGGDCSRSHASPNLVSATFPPDAVRWRFR